MNTSCQIKAQQQVEGEDTCADIACGFMNGGVLCRERVLPVSRKGAFGVVRGGSRCREGTHGASNVVTGGLRWREKGLVVS